MIIKTAEFLVSSQKFKQCPKPDRPEFAFIGRSNVGKSTLINMLTDKSKLAKTSSSPGKTQLINHFMINNEWYMVDLPGYGYAKVSKTKREDFSKLINDYILKRDTLHCLFVLIDSRHKPIVSDLEFIRFLGENGVPFALIFTKTDKLSGNGLNRNLTEYKRKLLEEWEELPEIFTTSSLKKEGKDEILLYIEKTMTDN